MVELDGKYIVILGSDGGDHRLTACASETEVFGVLTKEIQDEISWMVGPDRYWADEEEKLRITSLADEVLAYDLIDNPDEIMQIWMDWFSPTWWFTVLDTYGEVLFGVREDGPGFAYTV
jgi:hypothetical protein